MVISITQLRSAANIQFLVSRSDTQYGAVERSPLNGTGEVYVAYEPLGILVFLVPITTLHAAARLTSPPSRASAPPCKTGHYLRNDLDQTHG